jgi:phage-related protein
VSIVSFYTPVGKTSPIVEFLDSCTDSLRNKIVRQLKYVEEFGLTPAIPNNKKLTGTSLWELRILGKDNIRLICVGLSKNQVKVLHIFSKKSQKTPLKELQKAQDRYQLLVDR